MCMIDYLFRLPLGESGRNLWKKIVLVALIAVQI